jgi:hypothetical protein
LEEEEKRSHLTRTSAAGNPWTAATFAGITELWFVAIDDRDRFHFERLILTKVISVYVRFVTEPKLVTHRFRILVMVIHTVSITRLVVLEDSVGVPMLGRNLAFSRSSLGYDIHTYRFHVFSSLRASSSWR